MTARKTKIVATIGPASAAPDVLRRMMEAGVDVVRVNGSHLKAQAIAPWVALVRETAAALDRPVAVLLDLAGPKIRTGPLAGGGPVELTPGATLRITPGQAPGDAARVGCTYARLARDVRPGNAILVDDGLLELEVTAVEKDDVVCRVVVGGPLHERKGLNLPGTELDIPALTAKDREDLAAGVEAGIDYVALSFVQRPADVLELKEELRRLGADVPVVAKIEKPGALLALEEILDVSDAVMVARGDLGVEVGSHRVPMIQKRILRAASRHAVLDITATQMLDSMIRNPRPTRAEASDVANAILDGTDAVMLSGETATGRYPVQAVEMMQRIALEVERETVAGAGLEIDREVGGDATATAVARAACLLAQDPRFRAIIVLTGSGTMARTIAAFGPRAAILALTPNETTWRRLALVRGVRPVLMPFAGATDDILAAGEATLRQRGLLAPGDEAILVSGQLDSWGVTHLVKVFRVRGSTEAGPTRKASVAMTRALPMPFVEGGGGTERG